MSADPASLGSYDHAVGGVVIDLTENDLRITSLGIHQLVDPGGESEEALKPLVDKVNLARGVLSSRAQLRSDELELSGVDRIEASRQTNHGRPLETDTVKVRFNETLLEQAERALEAFLNRENPALERFGLREGQLVDPPVKVMDTRRKYTLALETIARRTKMAADEERLLA